MSNKVIVCTCLPTFKQYDPYWKTVDFDFEYLSDRVSEGVEYNEQTLRDTFNFKGDVSKKHWWNQQGNRNIIWFYAHIRMAYYYTLNPNEDWYWFMDDDVVCDNWSEFFKSFESNDADFISYYIHKNVGVQSQPNIPEIDGNTYSGPEWYERFPGDGDQVDTDSDLFGSFFPIVRFSNESLKYLVDIINKDIHGWHEGFVPTVLNQEGFKLDTIFNNQSRSDHFDVDKIHIKHKGIKVEWSWI
tara:strand:+ start:6440 stop:7168 length:729 start_codon:yes stop_codon:yes gene_type:complete